MSLLLFVSVTVFWSRRMTLWKSLTLERPKSSVTKVQRCHSRERWPGWPQRSSGMNLCLKKLTSGEHLNFFARWCKLCKPHYTCVGSQFKWLIRRLASIRIYNRQQSWYFVRTLISSVKLAFFTRVLQVLWSCVMGTADWWNSLQRRRLVRHHLGCRQQQSPPSCPLHLPRRLQNPHETNLVILSHSMSSIIGCNSGFISSYRLNNCHVQPVFLILTVWINHPPCLLLISRQGKPRNRPSFRQILLHLDIASADVLGAPQETYFKSQVCATWRKAQQHNDNSMTADLRMS